MKSELGNLRVAAVAALLALSWMAITVHFNYQGNWTALFCVGQGSKHAPELESGTYIFLNSKGYDGQWYRIVAHDPWLQKGMWKSLDGRERYQRILLPAIAWILALGQDRWIDNAYIAAVLLFLFAGVWLTAKWCALQGFSPWWGLGFIILPGVLISLDRMTVDIALYTFVALALVAWKEQRWVWCWVAGAGAFLARDLGFLLIAAMAGLCLLDKNWKRAGLFAAAALPALLWYRQVAHIARGPKAFVVVPKWVFHSNLVGPFIAIFRPRTYRTLTGPLMITTHVLDYGSILGVIAAVILAALLLRRRPIDIETAICLAYAALFLMVSNQGFWRDPYSYPRAFSPLLGLLAWRAVREKHPGYAIPLMLVLVRVMWQEGPQALHIAQSIF